MPSTALAASRVRPLAERAGRGLLETLAGPGPAPRWRSPWQRRAMHAVLAVATPFACLATLLSMNGVTSLLGGRILPLHAFKADHLHPHRC